MPVIPVMLGSIKRRTVVQASNTLSLAKRAGDVWFKPKTICLGSTKL
jgi:hypothetical protein